MTPVLMGDRPVHPFRDPQVVPHKAWNRTGGNHARASVLSLWMIALGVFPSSCASDEGATAGPSGPATSATSQDASAERALEPYRTRRSAHQTRLTKEGPITAQWPTFDELPAGARRVTYRSDGRELWGWYAEPPEQAGAAPGEKVPALVYFHGHFFMKPADFERLRPLLDRGFAIFTATLRGRNGNGGNHELMYGEVDDGLAAAAWLASQPRVDPARVYAFGHSMGGGVAAMMALYDDAAVRMTGGCGAVYSTRTFANWAQGRDRDLVRFDFTDPDETELRVLLPQAEQLQRPHIAYMGDMEVTTLRNARAVQARAQRAGKRFEVEVVPGGHAEAIGPALAAWFDRIAADAEGGPP